MISKEAVLELICEAKSVNIDERRVCFLRKIIEKDLDRLEELEKNTIEQRKIVLLTKDMVYFDTFTEKYFIKFLDFLNDNEVYCHIDTIYDFTEIWFSSCGKRKLYKLIIEFNNKETNNDK